MNRKKKILIFFIICFILTTTISFFRTYNLYKGVYSPYYVGFLSKKLKTDYKDYFDYVDKKIDSGSFDTALEETYRNYSGLPVSKMIALNCMVYSYEIADINIEGYIKAYSRSKNEVEDKNIKDEVNNSINSILTNYEKDIREFKIKPYRQSLIDSLFITFSCTMFFILFQDRKKYNQ